jgi:hypothetical protein
MFFSRAAGRFWSAVTCHRFPAGGLVPGEGASSAQCLTNGTILGVRRRQVALPKRRQVGALQGIRQVATLRYKVPVVAGFPLII